MNLVVCKCGKTTMNFARLNQESFGEAGWETDCCRDIAEAQVLQGLSEEPKEESEAPKAEDKPKSKKKKEK